MTFGRWLLVHSFSIFLVVLLVAGYVYREELRLQEAYHQLLNLSPQPTQETAGKSSSGSRSQVEPAAQAPEVATTPVARPSPAAEPQATLETGHSTLPESVNQTARNLPLVVSPTIESEVIELDGLLIEARGAFWDKRFDQAIQSYQALLQQQPTNPDLFGELGNVYYAMNDYQRAAEHYFEAASLLIQSGEVSRARQLIAPVTAMDRELGERLSSRLRRTVN